jgi:hypothetical protein
MPNQFALSKPTFITIFLGKEYSGGKTGFLSQQNPPKFPATCRVIPIWYNPTLAKNAIIL